MPLFNSDPKLLAYSLLEMTPEQLSELPHATLYSARAHLPPQFQDIIAPYEHQAFAREAVSADLSDALPIAAGIPLYQGYKAVMGARSEPSFQQVKQAYKGIGQGLLNRVRAVGDQLQSLQYADPFKPTI